MVKKTTHKVAHRRAHIIKNPTKMGKQKIKVTRLLKKRAVLAITLKGI